MRFALLPLTFLTLLLASCIDGDETIWIDKDGSGRIEASYTMPEAFMEELGGARELEGKLREAITKDESLELESIGSAKKGNRITFQFTVDFEDIRKLAEFPRRYLRDPDEPGTTVPEESLFGDIDLELNGLLISLYREIDLSPILPATAKNSPGFLGESTFRYTVHLPVSPTDHDAHQSSNEGKTLSWTFLLREHTKKPMTIWATASFPLPWWIWFSLILVVIVFLLLLIWAVKYTIALRA